MWGFKVTVSVARPIQSPSTDLSHPSGVDIRISFVGERSQTQCGSPVIEPPPAFIDGSISNIDKPAIDSSTQITHTIRGARGLAG